MKKIVSIFIACSLTLPLAAASQFDDKKLFDLEYWKNLSDEKSWNDKDFWPQLSQILDFNHNEILNDLLERNKLSQDTKNMLLELTMPLSNLNKSRGYLETAKLLLKHKANPNLIIVLSILSDWMDFLTPYLDLKTIPPSTLQDCLFSAIDKNDLKKAELFLNLGAKPNKKIFLNTTSTPFKYSLKQLKVPSNKNKRRFLNSLEDPAMPMINLLLKHEKNPIYALSDFIQSNFSVNDIKSLLEKLTLTDLTTPTGLTTSSIEDAFYSAVTHNREDVVELLLPFLKIMHDSKQNALIEYFIPDKLDLDPTIFSKKIVTMLINECLDLNYMPAIYHYNINKSQNFKHLLEEIQEERKTKRIKEAKAMAALLGHESRRNTVLATEMANFLDINPTDLL